MSTVLVTGGNTGIGYGTILALLKSTKQQYTVILGSRSLQRGQDAAANLSKETSTTDRVIAIQLDIEDEKSVKNAYAEIDAKFGRLDVLINNAGAPFVQSTRAGDIVLMLRCVFGLLRRGEDPFNDTQRHVVQDLQHQCLFDPLCHSSLCPSLA